MRPRHALLIAAAGTTALAGCGQGELVNREPRQRTVTVEVPRAGNAGETKSRFASEEKRCTASSAQPSRDNLAKLEAATSFLVNYGRRAKRAATYAHLFGSQDRPG